ncbi:MAG: IS982 family transposase [Anaerolineaceae bacterium]|nr:IS982 family transposase [Anaerolineaceae bacterium]
MINDFEDFCTWVFVIVDDIWKEIEPIYKRPGPKPKCSDSELIAMTMIGECRGWHMETEMLSYWQEYKHMFPNIPSQSRYNRRRRNLMYMVNLIRQVILRSVDLSHDRQCIIDSLPIPVVQFHLVPSSTGDWKAYDAAFGKVITKKQTIFGYKIHMLIAMNGLILDFELAPANCTDLEVGFELLCEHTDLEVIGDKGYISAQKAAELLHYNRVKLLTIPRSNMRKQPSDIFKHLHNSIRQLIETVNAQLSCQFGIEKNYAHTFWGLCTRLYSKLTAHTLCIYINRLLGKPNFLQIKALVFPI